MINQCWPYQVFGGLCPSLANDAAVNFFYLLWACAQSLHLSLHHCIFPSLLFTTVRSPTDKNSKWWNSTICIATCPHLTPMTKHNMGTQEGDELWSIKEKNWRTMQLMTEWKPSMHSCYSLAFDHISPSEALDCSALRGSPCGGQWDTTHLAPSVSHLHPSAGFSSSCLCVSSTTSLRRQA